MGTFAGFYIQINQPKSSPKHLQSVLQILIQGIDWHHSTVAPISIQVNEDSLNGSHPIQASNFREHSFEVNIEQKGFLFTSDMSIKPE